MGYENAHCRIKAVLEVDASERDGDSGFSMPCIIENARALESVDPARTERGEKALRCGRLRRVDERNSPNNALEHYGSPGSGEPRFSACVGQ